MDKEEQTIDDKNIVNHCNKKNDEHNDRKIVMEVDSTTSGQMNNNKHKSKPDIGSETNDIGLVVTKAKKAADSLWTLLHAQTCRRYSCTRACYESKRILLHIKTCKTSQGEGNSFKCPQNFKGCSQAKTLLAHYRRCRDTRHLQQQSNCLICSFLSRRARNLVEGNINGQSSSCRKVASLSPVRSKGNRFVKYDMNSNENKMIDSKEGNSSNIMPPPPPRFPLKSCLRTDIREGKKRSMSCADESSNLLVSTNRRNRSVSFDESLSSSNRYATVKRNDPTVEMLLTRTTAVGYENRLQKMEGDDEIDAYKENYIKRSNSCGILSSLSEEEQLEDDQIQLTSSTTY